MGKAVKKAISLPADLAAEVEAIAREKNKSLSAVVQDALDPGRRELPKFANGGLEARKAPI